jgi:prepilin-type processing-associated H-X9-DG protein
MDTVNVCFVDGHVKAMQISKMWNGGVSTGLYNGK